MCVLSSCLVLERMGRIVFGYGSNVRDLFFRVNRLPGRGEKVLLLDAPDRCGVSAGGVTLNHLAWAKRLGVPTGLLGRQGRDAAGMFLGREMKRMGLDCRGMIRRAQFSTGECHVLVSPFRDGGERTILMYGGMTVREDILTTDWERWMKLIGQHSSNVFTTEVSQVPLSVVLKLLTTARAKGITTAVDIDQPIDVVCTGEARLGEPEDLWRILWASDIIVTSSENAEKVRKKPSAPSPLRRKTSSPSPQKSNLQELVGGPPPPASPPPKTTGVPMQGGGGKPPWSS